MKIFLTGGTGFIGSRVIPKLIARGHEVYALARSTGGLAAVEALGAVGVRGDITDPASMRAAMRGSDAVFHIAGWYKIGAPDQTSAAAINVEGSRNVLGLACELSVPKILYTSTVAVFGDTRGQLVDETFYQGPPFLTEYDRTKWRAHYEVAAPLIEAGAPIIIAMPGGVYGPGDPSVVGAFLRMFYRGLLPVFPTPGTVITFAHVDDIAEGLILAWEKGRLGESYVLAGPSLSFSELLDLCASLTGRAAPLLHVPGRWLPSVAPLARCARRWLPLPEAFSGDSLALAGATYMATPAKARRELGWHSRSLLTGLEETLAWIAATETRHPFLHTRPRQMAACSLLAGLAALSAWLLTRRKK